MKKSLLTLEELSVWETLEVKGGVAPDENTQYSCVNGATGCGSGISQPYCTNNASQCKCTDSACVPPPSQTTDN